MLFTEMIFYSLNRCIATSRSEHCTNIDYSSAVNIVSQSAIGQSLGDIKETIPLQELTEG